MNKAEDYDVLILASDDMNPQFKGWDSIIRKQMRLHFKDGDGCLWFNDGHQNRICTLSILGKKYYERFGYIYHPSYVSLWCDNEFTEVAQSLGKLIYSPLVLFYHEHPMWTNDQSKNDELYKHNEGFYRLDQRNYQSRKQQGFPI
jgi:hypothetical protein